MLNGSLVLGLDARQAVGEASEAGLQFAGARPALLLTKSTAGRFQSQLWKSVILKTVPNGRKKSGLLAALLVALGFNPALSFASAMAKKSTTATATEKLCRQCISNVSCASATRGISENGRAAALLVEKALKVDQQGV